MPVVLLIVAVALVGFAASQGGLGNLLGGEGTSGDEFLDDVVSNLPHKSQVEVKAAAHIAYEMGNPRTGNLLDAYAITIPTAGTLGGHLLDPIEAEIKKAVEDYIHEGGDAGEDAVRDFVAAQFGDTAAGYLDQMFESEWWTDGKGWVAEKGGAAVEAIGDAAEDAWDEASSWVSGVPGGGTPETMKRFIVAQAVGLKEQIPAVRERLGQYVGTHTQVNGVIHPVTLSGLVALVSRAGQRGAKAWLDNKSDRQRFPATTEAFLACNGMF